MDCACWCGNEDEEGNAQKSQGTMLHSDLVDAVTILHLIIQESALELECQDIGELFDGCVDFFTFVVDFCVDYGGGFQAGTVSVFDQDYAKGALLGHCWE